MSVSKLIDISLPLSEELPFWPGNPPFRFEPIHRLATGAHSNESAYSTNIHTGTHIDVPWDFLPEADKTESVDLRALNRSATVLAPTGIRQVTAEDLRAADVEQGVDRLLLSTDNSRLWANQEGEFRKDFVALAEDAAEWLAVKHIKLIGIDYLSIKLYGGSNRTHEVLLEAGVIILEGLNLHHVQPGKPDLICLPLAIQGAQVVPARAVLKK
jgi:arylformamidase